MANNLDRIVTVNIDIAAPAVDGASFDCILIVGLPPAREPERPLPDVGAYSSLEEVTGAGFAATGENADPVGIAARIAFSQSPRPTRIFIAAQKGTETMALEPPTDTLDRALGMDGWYVICPAGVPESQLEEIAEWTEARTKMLAYTYLSEKDPVSPVYFRSHGWCGLTGDGQDPADAPQANAYLHAAAAAKCLSHPAGSETWAFKRLAAVHPSRFGTTMIAKIVNGNGNYFARHAGRNITMNGITRGGEWIDIIRGRDWLQNDMQLRIFNLLLTRPKIPFTNPGIALVENEMIASLKAAQGRGIVAPDEYDGDGNLVPGFIVKVPNAQSLTATQRASRRLAGCKFSARLAGAIHAVRVDGALTYEGGDTFGTDI